MLLRSQWQGAALRALRAAFARFVSGASDKGHLEVERKFALAAAEVTALRARLEQLGFTYKQWVKTASGKERRETEREVRTSTAALWKLLGRVISGEPLLSFSKQRQLFDGKLGGADAVVSIDEVTGLGSFSGWYMEVEVLVPLDGDTAAWQERIFALVRDILQEHRPDVKRSYMDMLKESRKA
jgi:adenylate cyclase class IV